MESKAFHICPFCQSPSPASASRCARCDRSLAGLPLPIYGSELDAASMRSEPGDLVDLPLRDDVEGVPIPVVTAAAAPAPNASPPEVSAPPRRGRRRRAAKMGAAAAMMGALLIGGWLVRAQGTPTSAPAAEVPDTALSASPAAMAPGRVATRISKPEPGPPVSAPARRTSIGRDAGAAPVRQAASRQDSAPWDITPPPAEPPRATADVSTVHPDVRATPVGVERMPEDLRRDSTAGARDDDARADLRARLGRAEQRRQALTERLGQLRARTNVPVIRDVDEYQRLQEQLSDTLDELDRVEAQIARLRRALGNGRE
ncbi:MAG TPA: hypothetical protein VFT38_02175 [Vicinamibacteria bacterium]|nr:hypothetical protein [Vicinamibacteria bacterium]